MQRPLAVLAAAACGLLLLSVVANLIAIQETSPARRAAHEAIVRVPLTAPAQLAQPSVEPPLEPVEIAEQAQALAQRMLQESALGPLGESGGLPYTARTRLIVESKASGRWVTLTEVRAPCEAVDRALARVPALALGRPDRCERWVETTAAVLERHGVTEPSAREFLKQHTVDTDVRVLLVYAGWQTDPKGGAPIALAAAGSASVYPRESFSAARSAALDAIYRELRLGPYSEG